MGMLLRRHREQAEVKEPEKKPVPKSKPKPAPKAEEK
ncbi:hypothetical protein QFZ79_002896 [Arthrobacter sp. V4I6]|nr:hypothetical protein [Arthrobacter sp. V4I6]